MIKIKLNALYFDRAFLIEYSSLSRKKCKQQNEYIFCIRERI